MKSHFQRKEIKYRLTKGQMDSLIALLGDELVFDFYCPTGQPYHISSIYYDTPNYDVIRRSNDKPRHKAKLRLRTYEDNSHYLELKQKYRGIVYKKRIALSEQELGNLSNVEPYLTAVTMSHAQFLPTWLVSLLCTPT